MGCAGGGGQDGGKAGRGGSYHNGAPLSLLLSFSLFLYKISVPPQRRQYDGWSLRSLIASSFTSLPPQSGSPVGRKGGEGKRLFTWLGSGGGGGGGVSVGIVVKVLVWLKECV